MDFKKLLPALLPAVLAAAPVVAPSLQDVVSVDPLASAAVAGLVAFFAHLAPSPLKK